MKKRRGKRTTLTNNTPEKGKQNPCDSGPAPVACGGSGAKAPPLAARPKELQTDDTTSTDKIISRTVFKKGPWRFYFSRSPLRERGPCEVTLHLALILSKREMGDI